jgi:putative sterol carrier protein
MAYTYGTEEWENAYREEVGRRLASESRPFIVATPEWTAEFEGLVQEDADYREYAKEWEGSVALQINAEPEAGLDDDIFILMDLWHGDCRSIRIVPREAAERADYQITGDYAKWKAVLQKELDVVKAIMQGKLKLRGDLPTIVRNVKAATRLVELAGMVEGRFPDEMPEPEREKFRAWVKDMRGEFGV